MNYLVVMVFFEVLPHQCELVAAFERLSKLIWEMAFYFVYQTGKHCNLASDQKIPVDLLSCLSSSCSAFFEYDNGQVSYAKVLWGWLE